MHQAPLLGRSIIGLIFRDGKDGHQSIKNRRRYPNPSRVVIYVIDSNFLFNDFIDVYLEIVLIRHLGQGLSIYLFTFLSNRFWVFSKFIFYRFSFSSANQTFPEL